MIPLQPSRIKTSKRPIAVFDTGTTLILGPTADVTEFYASLSLGNATNTKGGWLVDCNLAVDLVIVIGGRMFPIHPLDMAWDKITDENGMCMGGLQANDEASQFIPLYSCELTTWDILSRLGLVTTSSATQ